MTRNTLVLEIQRELCHWKSFGTFEKQAPARYSTYFPVRYIRHVPIDCTRVSTDVDEAATTVITFFLVKKKINQFISVKVIIIIIITIIIIIITITMMMNMIIKIKVA